MTEFEEIESLKNDTTKNNKLKKYYIENVKIDDWMNNNIKNQIIHFKDRIEYKMNGVYHRINGPAVEHTIDKDKDSYYYKGKLYTNKDEWYKITTKEVRKIKIKKLNSTNEKSSE